MAADERDDELARLELALGRSRRRWRLLGPALALISAGVAAALLLPICLGPHVYSWLRRETDLDGRWRRRPLPAVDRRHPAGVDLEAVHRDLLPRWAIAAARRDGDAEARFATLRRALAADPSLVEIADELHQRFGDVAASQARLGELCRAWNERLGALALPYRVDAVIDLRPDGGRGYVTTARVLAALAVQVGDQSVPAQLLVRLDQTNLVEQYLGATGDPRDGARVLLDRLIEHATDRVWPLLDADGDGELPAGQRAFAPAVRKELAAGLPERARAILERTAPHRRRLIAAIDGINDRRRCGSSFTVWSPPPPGLAPADYATLRRAVQGSTGHPCPKVKADELAAIIESSEALRGEAALDQALGPLLAWLARGVVVHEARHAADGDPPPCPACEAALGPIARGELSAYLASFAAPLHAVTSLHQACTVDEGAHARALAFALSRLGGLRCDRPPPADLAARAAALAEELFGPRDGVTLPPGFPSTLPLGR